MYTRLRIYFIIRFPVRADRLQGTTPRATRQSETWSEISLYITVAIGGGGVSFGLDPVRVRRRCRFSTLNGIDIGPANYGAIRIGLYGGRDEAAAVARWLVVPILPPQLPLIIIINNNYYYYNDLYVHDIGSSHCTITRIPNYYASYLYITRCAQ